MKKVVADVAFMKEYHNTNLTQCLSKCQRGEVPGCRSVFHKPDDNYCQLSGVNRYTGDMQMEYNNETHGEDYWEIYRGGYQNCGC